MTAGARLWCVVATASVLSIAGILYAALWSKDASDGGRGGAIAVAVSFAVLFLTRSLGQRVYQALTQELPALRKLIDSFAPASASKSEVEVLREDLKAVGDRFSALEQRLESDDKATQTQNRFLAAASVIGTLVWGFGDVVAGWIIALRTAATPP